MNEAKNCVTHHAACACREAAHEAEIARLKADLEQAEVGWRTMKQGYEDMMKDRDRLAAELPRRDEVIQRFVSFITEQVDVEELPAVLDDARTVLARHEGGE